MAIAICIEDVPRMLNAVRSFLAVAFDDEQPSLVALANSLDALAVAFAALPPFDNPSEDDPSELDEPEPPKRDYASTYAIVSKRFPDLGYYGVADPLKLTEGGWMIGDAIDDITDIANDLSQVLWRYRNIGPHDAKWHFVFGFESHWGRHLRELQFFLHFMRFYRDLS